MKAYYWIIINHEYAIAGTQDKEEAMQITLDAATRNKITQLEYNGEIIWKNY
ncbi:MAG: hypothetical protein U0L43_12640 [Muribaculaceae bacterium]|nr:hypothetical protein [Muribaculaceae bacterium]